MAYLTLTAFLNENVSFNGQLKEIIVSNHKLHEFLWISLSLRIRSARIYSYT